MRDASILEVMCTSMDTERQLSRLRPSQRIEMRHAVGFSNPPVTDRLMFPRSMVYGNIRGSLHTARDGELHPYQ